MGEYGRDFRAGRQVRGRSADRGEQGRRFEGFQGRGVPGSWTHFGPGHGRGGGIPDEDAWRANRDDFRYDGSYRVQRNAPGGQNPWTGGRAYAERVGHLPPGGPMGRSRDRYDAAYGPRRRYGADYRRRGYGADYHWYW